MRANRDPFAIAMFRIRRIDLYLVVLWAQHRRLGVELVNRNIDRLHPVGMNACTPSA